MQFVKGTTVLNAHGERVGKVASIFVDPESRDVTHLVVSGGMLLPRDSIVPVDRVEGTSGEEVVLHPDTDLRALAPFSAEGYANEPHGREPMAGFVLYPLAAIPQGGLPQGGLPSGAVRTPGPGIPDAPQRAAPAGTVAVDRGTPVLSEDSGKLGKVEEVITSDDGSIEAIVVKSGFWLFTRRRVVPVGWIRDIRSDEIRLSVTKRQAILEGAEPTASVAQRPPGR